MNIDLKYLFKEDGDLDSMYKNLSCEEVAEAMGVTFNEDDYVEQVNWDFIKSMKNSNYHVDSDFCRFYYAIMIAENSYQPLYYVFDKWFD